MLTITVSVPEDRLTAGVAELSDATSTAAQYTAVATSDPQTARRQGNPQCDPLRPAGHAPFGRYELTSHGAPPPGGESEYGSTLLLFEPRSGPALDAESYGRLGLLVYAGARGRDMYPRRTQGGVRVSQSLMDALVVRLAQGVAMELRIEALPKPYWWAFWRKQRASPLSKDGPQVINPPLDEASLAAELLRTAVRPTRTVRAPSEDDFDRDRHRRDDRDDRTSSRSAPEVRGGGGTGGGGGASGAWSDAPAAGRGPGVDAAGRILAAAAGAGIGVVAASVAAASAAQRDAADDVRSDAPSDATETPTRSDNTDHAIDTQTSTSY